MTRTVFPLLDQDRTFREKKELIYPKGVPWEFIEPHEGQALSNHDQTLRRLADRGGLSPQEMIAVIEGWSLRKVIGMKLSDNDALTRIREKLVAKGMDFVT